MADNLKRASPRERFFEALLGLGTKSVDLRTLGKQTNLATRTLGAFLSPLYQDKSVKKKVVNRGFGTLTIIKVASRRRLLEAERHYR